MPINISPTGLARDLQTRADSGKPIRIGLVGSGEMGTDIVTRVAHMPGNGINQLGILGQNGIKPGQKLRQILRMNNNVVYKRRRAQAA